MATPSPTPWDPTNYVISDGTDGFHNLPRLTGSNEFPVDDVTDTSYYINIGVTAALPVVCFLLAVPIFWFYLCCRSGCCSCCCGKCKRITDCLCGCCCKSMCCPDTSHVEPEGGLCSSCMCKKDKTKTIHGGLCAGKPIMARLVLIIIFVALGLINLGVRDGMATLRLAVDDLVSIADNIGDIFTSLQEQGVDLEINGNIISKAASALETSCTINATRDGAAAFVDPADMLSSAGSSIDDMLDGLAQKMYNIADQIDGGFSGNNYNMATAALLFGAIFSALGLLGSLCLEMKTVICRWSSSLLAFTQFIGLILLLLLSIVVAVEMALGMTIGDYCAAGPIDAFVGIVSAEVSGDAADILEYFTSNTGSNPFDSYYEDALDAGDTVNQTLTDYRSLFVSSSMCCTSTNLNNVSDFDKYCEYYFGTNDCVADSTCYTTDSVQGLCVAGSACNTTAYDNIVDSILFVLIDKEGPIADIFDLISFDTLNVPFTTLLNSALCTHTVDGLYTLFSTHASVLLVTWLAMFLVSLLRQSIVGTQCCFAGDHNKVGKTEFAQSNQTWVQADSDEGDGIQLRAYDPNSLKHAHAGSGPSSPAMRAQL